MESFKINLEIIWPLDPPAIDFYGLCGSPEGHEGKRRLDCDQQKSSTSAPSLPRRLRHKAKGVMTLGSPVVDQRLVSNS
jgi:hypothetical protein